MTDTQITDADRLRSNLDVLMLAAWLNVDPEQVPTEYKSQHLNANTMAAWARVGEAATAYAERELAQSKAEMERLKREVEFWTASANAHEEDVLRKAVWRMGWPEIKAFQDELSKGQDVREDAGGYFMRAIGRLFGVKPERDEVTTYQDAAMAIIDTLATESQDG